MYPLISVIIPIYNSEPYLKECLDSVFAQKDAPPFEVIAIDDGSPDNSAHIASDYPELKLLRHRTNLGQSEARNTGVNEARGKYILFIDSDDYISPDALARLWETASKYPSADIVYGVAQAFPRANHTDKYYDLKRCKAKDFDDNIKSVRRSHSLFYDTPWNKLIKRQWLVDNELFFIPKLIHEDFEWHLRALDFIKAYATVSDRKTPTYFYRQHSGSITGRQPIETRWRILANIFIERVPKMRTLDKNALRMLFRQIHSHSRIARTAHDKSLRRRLEEVILNHPEMNAYRKMLLKVHRYYPRFFPLRPFLWFLK